jgi:leader peptidase (prepilin peptidase)/N-methyltransferase
MSEPSLELLTSPAIVVIWMAAIGACIGSFLNVVVYRMPAGKSIVHPGSHCPACGHPIRGYDNVPVVSWLVLGGRCRDCRAPISVRYPLVEATVALVFAVICRVEILTGGQNLPGPALAAPELAGGASWIMGAYHLCLLCTLLCVALIHWDRKPAPLLLTGPILLIGLAAPTGFPLLKPIVATGRLAADSGAGPVAVLATGLAGGAAGLLFGLLAWPSAGRACAGGIDPVGSIFAVTMVGSFLGWQAIMVIACVATALHTAIGWLLHALRSRWGVPWSAWLATTTWTYLIVWGTLAGQVACLVTEARGATLAAAYLGTCGLSAWAWMRWRPEEAGTGA